MTTARRKQVRLDVTPYYHCITRCVRRSFLCGFDKLTRKNFDHRRSWIEKRILLLTQVFCIECAGYAIMCNHYHTVLKINKARADTLTDDEVISRWLMLYRGTDLAQRQSAGDTLTRKETILLRNTVAQWRENLSNISRFMGNLNEHIARKANKEDGCKGTFWESRFKTQAILDLPALLQTLCYVDLNPVRAKMAKTPEQSKYTSVNRRINHTKPGLVAFKARPAKAPDEFNLQEDTIPIGLKDYLELLDWVGKESRKGKRGSIEAAAPSIMSRMGFTPEQWLKTQTPQIKWKQKALGSVERIKEYCNAIGQRWIWQAV